MNLDSQNSWDRYFLEMAYFVARKSKDPSTKCGTVIVDQDHGVLTTGYNGLPRGVKDDLPERNERPQKYLYYEHSERNAIFNAARAGTALKGSTAYLNWPPCSDCGRALIQSGIKRCVWVGNTTAVTDPEKAARWQESMDVTLEMFKESGMEVRVEEGLRGQYDLRD